MRISERDRRALLGLGGAVAVFLLLQFDFVLPSATGAAVSASEIRSEEDLLKLAQVTIRQKPLLDGEFETVEKARQALETKLLTSETAALAQAEMREIAGRLMSGAGIQMKATRFGRVQREGEDYTQVPLIVQFTCAVESFVNLMSDIANADVLLSTREIKVSPARGETKTIRVELTFSGYLPVSRTPELVKQFSTGGRG